MALFTTEFDFAHEAWGLMTVRIDTENRTNVCITVRDGNGFGGGPSSVDMSADELRIVLKALEIHENGVKEIQK